MNNPHTIGDRRFTRFGIAALAVLALGAGAISRSGCRACHDSESGVSASAAMSESSGSGNGNVSFASWSPETSGSPGTVTGFGDSASATEPAPGGEGTTIAGTDTDTSASSSTGQAETGAADQSSGAGAAATSAGASTGPGNNPNKTTESDPLPVCGNGVVETGEECDDGADNDRDGIDGCDACLRTARFAFVTSGQYQGFGLTQGWADAECAVLGHIAGYPSIPWRAWLSRENENAIDRIGASKLPYILLDKTKLTLTGAADFAAPTLLAPLNINELGKAMEPGMGVGCDNLTDLVWTFTGAGGVLGVSCDNAIVGTVGGFSTVDDAGGWTALCELSCEQLAHVYCIEWAP